MTSFHKLFRIVLPVILICSLLCACGDAHIKKGITAKKYDENSTGETSAPEGTVYENDRFCLSWDAKFSQVIFTDKQSGTQYSTMPQQAKNLEVDEDGMEIKNSPIIESPIVVYYYDSTLLTDTDAVAATGSIYNDGLSFETLENGIRVTYRFPELQFSVPVEYTVDDDCFRISVNPKEIADNGEMFVTGVAIAPFMCSLQNDTDNSYLFIPDGSGALAEPKTVNSVGKQYSVPVYGRDLSVIDITLESYSEDVKLPVFGMKNRDSALCGIITSAAEQASINWNIGSQNVGYSAVYPFFRIKGYSLVHKPYRFLAAKDEIQVYGENIVDTPIEVTYYPLSGENADYNGMADVYRNYLSETKQLKKQESDDTALCLKLLGGVQQKAFTFGIPHTVLKSLTTVDESQEIIRYFSEKTDANLLVNLVGYGESGLDVGKIAGGFKIAPSLGNKKSVNKLTACCKENGIDLFMDFDFIAFKKSCGGFKKNKDSAKLPNGQTVLPTYYNFITGTMMDSNRYLLLSRDSLSKAFSKANEYTQKMGFTGISAASLSRVKYADYGAENAEVCTGQGSAVTEIFGSKGKQKVLSNSANDYAACCSDYVMEAPTGNSRYEVADIAVPFYQMVFRGYVPMSSESFNTGGDAGKMLLKCVESGMAPTFTLCYDYDETLVSEKFTALHGARFEGNKENIVKTVQQLQPVLNRLSGQSIVHHEILSNGLRVTSFENGTVTVVNETEKDAVYNNIAVTAGSFAVLEGTE